ncbi:hypothetical protein [Rhodococcus erythropolis]|uniref:hypothetical protein n=1 Tax=Rhodococcus erythropolis TaxID=1833 RepID=UPI0022B493BE|nr:hypothetical protein [Rhodococcus erythropolis]MCZ4566206.1 hypothetical protein [Rhodococcus erythropolis]
MTKALFLGPRAKVDLARIRASQLADSCKSWAADHPVALHRRVLDYGWYEWYTENQSTVPGADLSVLAGEVLYNLRSALDQAAWALIVANGGTPSPRSTYFPIARKPVAWPSMRGKYLKGASESAINMIERWQPVTLNPEHPDRNALALIDELGLIDKHRLLYTSASTLGDVAISLVGESEVSAGRLLEQVERRIDDYLPFTEEQWILRARVIHDDGTRTVDLSFPLDVNVHKIDAVVTFHAPTSDGGRISVVGETFGRMVDHVEAILDDLEPIVAS